MLATRTLAGQEHMELGMSLESERRIWEFKRIIIITTSKGSICKTNCAFLQLLSTIATHSGSCTLTFPNHHSRAGILRQRFAFHSGWVPGIRTWKHTNTTQGDPLCHIERKVHKRYATWSGTRRKNSSGPGNRCVGTSVPDRPHGRLDLDRESN